MRTTKTNPRIEVSISNHSVVAVAKGDDPHKGVIIQHHYFVLDDRYNRELISKTRGHAQKMAETLQVEFIDHDGDPYLSGILKIRP